jgi:uncharacterized Zn-binding protein involved in type VI secretion
MGTPAATITSQTAHGGVVILGFPQVLINFMPASRITDMHTCPMVTGIVPHVGGPFILGSMTVLTGMMPQSRVTDQLTCVGPPDVCVMGAATVLVGMAGAGGAAGAGGGIAAMGISVPMQNPAAALAASTQAVLQSDGTIATQTTAPLSSLPPIQLQSPGFPDLPAEVTASFQSVAPVTLPQGTQLFAAAASAADTAPSFWSTVPPEITSGANDLVKVLTVTAPGGLKAWAGQPATAITPAISQAQQAAQQAANEAQRNLQQVQQETQKQMQEARQAVWQAQQQFEQDSAQGKAAGQQALRQAQQQLEHVQQQGVTALQQAQQQVNQTQRQAKQALLQAQQEAYQAQQASNEAKQQGTQVWTSADSAANQAIQTFAAPRKG